MEICEQLNLRDYPQNDSEEQDEDLCILCCSTIKVNCAPPQNTEQLLSSNLNVVFLLSKVLQVPGSQLEEYLRESGDPVNWISVCDKCSQLTKQAEELHWEIVKIKEQLRCVEQLIVDKLRVPSCPSPLPNYRDWKKEKIWRRTRAFISTHDYSIPVNPFIEGEKLATYLSNQKIGSSTLSASLLLVDNAIMDDSQVVKVEVDQFKDEEAEEDADWEPPEEDPAEVTLNAPILLKTRNKYKKVNGKYKCPLCDKVFPFYKSVTRHLQADHLIPKTKRSSKKHRIPRPPPPPPKKKAHHLPQQLCKICGKSFKTSVYLSEHVKIVHNRQFKLKCHLCGRGYSRQSKLNLHLLFRHKDDPQTVKLKENGYQVIRCKYSRCNAYYTKQSSMDKHIKIVHSSFEEITKRAVQFTCKICGQIFTSKWTLEHHQQSEHGDKEQFKCDICDLGLKSSGSLETHKRWVHSVGKRGPCKNAKGVKRVHKVIQVICHLCGKIYPNNTCLKKHLVSKHPEDTLAKQLIEEGFGIFKCGVPCCTRRFVRKEKLEEHVNKVHQDNYGDKVKKMFFCQFCGKGFYAVEGVRWHENNVHGEGMEVKGFKCEFCGFEVATKSYLEGHIQRVHRPNKKFGGEVKGEKVVICRVCGMQFFDKGKLDKHLIIHDKEAEQPHKCEVCGRAYSTHESMWKHKRKVHRIYRRPDDSRIKK